MSCFSEADPEIPLCAPQEAAKLFENLEMWEDAVDVYIAGADWEKVRHKPPIGVNEKEVLTPDPLFTNDQAPAPCDISPSSGNTWQAAP